MADWIFLDNHTQTRPSKELIEMLARDLGAHWLVGPKQLAQHVITEHLGHGHFSITSGGAAANFQVLFSHYIDWIRETGRTHILTVETEHPSILDGIKWLEKFEVQGKVLSVNSQGQLTANALQEALRARSGLLSLSWVNPLTGVIQPIHNLIDVCHAHDIRVHVDVSAALGKLSCLGLNADFLTFDGGLLHCPGELGGILSKEPLMPLKFGAPQPPYAHFAALAKALEMAQDSMDHYAMEVGRLRDLLEKKLVHLGAKVYFQDVERLPNCAVASFEGIHSELLLERLKKQGVFATNGEGRLAHMLQDPYLNHCALSFVLSDETTQEEVERVVAIIKEEVAALTAQSSCLGFSEEDAKTKSMRLCKASGGKKEEGRWIALSALVDEEDGIIADCQYEAFGPPSLHNTAKASCELALRKNYMQAKRLSADLIEQKMATPDPSHLNFLIDVIDRLCEACMDIPIEDVYVAPPDMGEGERHVYPGWETLSDAQKKAVITEVMERDIQPYVELDAGGVEVVKVEDNRITIAYSGNCTSCFSATGATLDAIGNILRHKIFPDLMVIPDLNLLSP